MPKVERMVTLDDRQPTLRAGRRRALVVLLGVFALGCSDAPAAPEPTEPQAEPVVEPPVVEAEPDPPPPVLADPLALWQDGASAREVDGATADEDGHLILELGEVWTPYLFSERDGEGGERLNNAYRETYLALARGEYPDDHHGERARRDIYLELYGIMPTLGLLRGRFHEATERDCAAELDYEPFAALTGVVAYRNNDRARRDARRFRSLERQIAQIVERQEVAGEAEIDVEPLNTRDTARVREYRELAPRVFAVRATQARLACEGFFEGKGRYERGALDWTTHEALAEFERRHRVYGWGFLGESTVRVLSMTPGEAERESVLRVLTERAMHAAGVLEDGSTSELRGEPRTFRGADGEQHTIPNFEVSLREAVIEAFGLQTPASTLAWLDSLGDLEPEGHHRVALPMPERPEYYRDDMELSVTVDRGDVWYEFPYDELGQERAQPTRRRPRLTVFTTYLGQRIPLARLGTTVGGWRSDYIEGTLMWKYKGSPVGPRVWHQIVASPVWLPPESTPPRSLLTRSRGPERFRPNYHETGPSYASAYGLVAAYHRTFRRNAEGEIRMGGDEGIRAHGSVDYMSIMRRHSHGCHRMHNHIAVRLMSFVLAHHPHERVGQQAVAFRRELEHDDEIYNLEINQGGYIYRLTRPLHVNVLEGNIRGRRLTPIEHAMPKFDDEVGAYVMPDGQTVTVDRMGTITPITLPEVPPEGELVPTEPGLVPATPGTTTPPVATTPGLRPPGNRSLTTGLPLPTPAAP